MEDDEKYTRITLRIPKDVHRRLGAEADRTSKSLNAEIISRLECSFEPSDNASLLQQLANERKSNATVLGLLSTTLANILLTALRLFTPEQRKKLVQIGVWEAIAEGVVNGRGAAIAEMLESMRSDGIPDKVDNPKIAK